MRSNDNAPYYLTKDLSILRSFNKYGLYFLFFRAAFNICFLISMSNPSS